MYLEIDFPLSPDQRAALMGREGGNAADFRRRFAESASRLGWDSAFEVLHYSAEGRPLDGQAPVWFQAYPKGVRLIGIGERGVALMSTHLIACHRAITTLAGGAVPMTPRSGQCGIGLSYPRSYFASTLAFAYKTKRSWYWAQMDACSRDPAAFLAIPEVQADLSSVVTRSLLRCAEEVHGTDGLEAASEGEVDMDTLKSRLTVRVAAAKRFVILDEGKGTNRTLGLGGVEIVTNAHLVGPWAVGRFASRGYGALHEPYGNGSLGAAE